MPNQEILDQLKIIMDNMATKEDLEASEMRTKIFIENNVSKKIEALFDGYKLAHDKQWELEHRVEKLEQIIQELQARIA